MDFKISKSKINKILLYGSALLVIIKMLTRLNNSVLDLSYDNVYTYNFLGSNLYGKANLWAIYCLIAFFLLNGKECLMKRRDFALVLICLGTFLYWTITESMNGNLEEAICGSIPTTLCLIPLFFLYGKASGVSNIINSLSKFLSVGFLAITVVASIDTYTNLGYGIRILSSPAKDSLSMAVLSLWVYVFSGKTIEIPTKEKRIYYIKIILITVATICSVAIISRSWTIQCFILLIAYMLVSSENKKQSWKIIKIAIGLGALLLLLSFGFQELVGSLLERVGDDTRSGQYEQFFSQVQPSSLVFGNGMNATYKFNGIDYSYFDNQVFFTAFHYGILPFIALFVFLMRLLRCKLRAYSAETRKLVLQKKIITLLFTLALCGLAVYLKYDWTISIALVLMYIGSFEQDLLNEKVW